MDLLAAPVRTADGTERTLGDILGGRSALVVNVASRCGLTPQYAALQALHEQHEAAGFTVLVMPYCALQNSSISRCVPGSCPPNWLQGKASTFSRTGKVVNGPHACDLWRQLTALPDADGRAGEVEWNFEKFLVTPDGATVRRFRPPTGPQAPEVQAAVEAVVSR